MKLSLINYSSSQFKEDYSNSMCPHDGWLESVVIQKVASGDRSQVAETNITIGLLGAYQDGNIRFHYEKVRLYEVRETATNPSRADWLSDEIVRLPDGYIRHIIIWDNGTWVIVAAVALYDWEPKSTTGH